MELIENFGLNPILLGAQIVNFLIILFILKKFLYKPILTTLEKRKATIKEGLDKTEEVRIRLEETIEKEKRILRTAQEQARKILDEARIQVSEEELVKDILIVHRYRDDYYSFREIVDPKGKKLYQLVYQREFKYSLDDDYDGF